MPRSLFIPSLLALSFAWGDASSAGDPEPAKSGGAVKAEVSASASVKLEVDDAAALEEDILLTIELPVVAAEARDAGVDPVEVSAAVDAVADAGMPVSDATVVLDAAAGQAKKDGAPKHFGAWVRLQVARGLRGKQLADAIKKKKADYRELTPEEQAEVDKNLGELHVKWVEHRKALWTLRIELLGKGKKSKIVAQAAHKKLIAAQGKNAKRHERLEKAIAEHPEHKAQLEKLLGKVDDRGDKLEKIEEHAEKKAEHAEKKAEHAEKKAEHDAKKAEHDAKKLDKGKKKDDGKGEGKGG